MSYVFKTVFLGLILAGSQAQAVEYNQLQTGQSSLTFGYRQMGVPMEGKFKQFAAGVSFDPVNLANAHAQFDVNLASIETGSADADEEVLGKKWFNAKTYPQASFVSSGIKSLGGNRYQATGQLAIKGKTQAITAPVTFSSDGNRGVFDGSFNIKRLSYAIGTGEWADLGTVADEIQIKFRLVVLASSVAPSSTQPPRKKP